MSQSQKINNWIKRKENTLICNLFDYRNNKNIQVLIWYNFNSSFFEMSYSSIERTFTNDIFKDLQIEFKKYFSQKNENFLKTYFEFYIYCFDDGKKFSFKTREELESTIETFWELSKDNFLHEEKINFRRIDV